MATFRVYIHPTRGHEAVKVGFSWPALFFGAVWLLVKRLWAYSALLVFALVAIRFIERVTEAADSRPVEQAVVYLILSAGSLAAWLVPAVRGNAWRAANLATRGYELLAEAEAASPDAAIARAVRSPTAAPEREDPPHQVSKREFVCGKCHHRISAADAAWDKLVAQQCCPRCYEPVTLASTARSQEGGRR